MLDMFFSCAQVKRKRRVHFHNFMIDVHKRLSAVTIRKFNAGIGIHQWRTTKSPEEHDPIPPLAANLAAEACLLCFDEFQVTYSSLLPLCLVINNWEKVTDVADAAILHRLFRAMMSHGCVVVATSNRAPDGLSRHFM